VRANADQRADQRPEEQVEHGNEPPRHADPRRRAEADGDDDAGGHEHRRQGEAQGETPPHEPAQIARLHAQQAQARSRAMVRTACTSFSGRAVDAAEAVAAHSAPAR
jgi:hypothetical protein